MQECYEVIWDLRLRIRGRKKGLGAGGVQEMMLEPDQTEVGLCFRATMEAPYLAEMRAAAKISLTVSFQKEVSTCKTRVLNSSSNTTKPHTIPIAA